MNNKFIVYCHTNKINGKRYVGITRLEPNVRWKNGNGYYRNEHFYSAIKKYGWEEFAHEILFEDLTEQEACEKEKELIAKWNLCDSSKGYNNSYGGEHGEMSEEAKTRFSLKTKGHGYWKGKVIPKEARIKMSLAKKGKIPKSNPPKQVFCEETGKIYESLSEASRSLGICLAYVYKLCNGEYSKIIFSLITEF